MICISCIFKKCPTKADRHFFTEEEWAARNWTPEEIERNIALPHKLWNMKHDDLLWPFCHTYRGADAFGPRAPIGHKKHYTSPPLFVRGRGVARWMTPGDTSILEIPLLADYRNLWTRITLPASLEVIERKDGAPNNGERYTMRTVELLEKYGPSPLQKFSEASYVVTDPYHISFHRIIQKREVIGNDSKPDIVLFGRMGARWDSYDDYYVKGSRYFGLRWN